MTVRLMDGGEGCHETNLAIWGGSVVPMGLEDYTDGYMMGLEMILSEGIDFEDKAGNCFALENDTFGEFCYFVQAGADDYLLEYHSVSYWYYEFDENVNSGG